MSARAIGSATVSFGLVSIPVKVYSTTESASSVRFNMLHKDCGQRVKQQYNCPAHPDASLSRSDLGRGYEFAKGQYVMLSDDEYKALQEVASNAVSLCEFVPADKIDPVYFDKAYFLGPEKGGERAYALLIEAMVKTGLVGLAKYAARGKQYLVMLRPNGDGGLTMQQLHYADQIREFDEVPMDDAPETNEAELGLAVQIIEQISVESFEPAKYEDEVKGRMLELIQEKIDGKEIQSSPEAAPEAKVIDLMEALKKSLGDSKADGKPAKTKKAKASSTKKTTKAKKAPAKKKAAK